MKRTVYLLVVGVLFSLTACQPEAKVSPVISSNTPASGAARVAATRTPSTAEKLRALELEVAIQPFREVYKVQHDQSLSDYAFSVAMRYAYGDPSVPVKPYEHQGFLLLDTRLYPYKDVKTGTQVALAWLTNFYNFQTLLNPKFTRFGAAFIDMGDGSGIWAVGFQGGAEIITVPSLQTLSAIPANMYSNLTGNPPADMLQLINKLRASGCNCPDGKFYPSVKPIRENRLMSDAAEESADKLKEKMERSVNSAELPAISSFGYLVFGQKASSAGITIDGTASTAGPMSKAEINYRAFTKWKELACPQIMNAEYENLGVGNSDKGSVPFVVYLAKPATTHY